MKSPRIILISQWPNVKNGEYELIEKIKRTGFKVAVVDFLGFDVETGECINTPSLTDEFDFAISFHYDTPKFLNILTFLWVANPLEFMHLRHDYMPFIFNNLRAYDGYLFNGSETLEKHIKSLQDTSADPKYFEMYAACSHTSLQVTNLVGSRLFYCGINWERGIDKAGRAEGLLNLLDQSEKVDFFGPRSLEGRNTWAGFKHYKGEIPFDGVSMSVVMAEYAAVLAISSPAHLRSKTSSSRVFEGVAAGVPVISDLNPHVQKLFGDSVYYFDGMTDLEKANSILVLLEHIRKNPEEAKAKVKRAQELVRDKYCFEVCFQQVTRALHKARDDIERKEKKIFDVFLYTHEPDPNQKEVSLDEAVVAIYSAAEEVAEQNITVRLNTVENYPIQDVGRNAPPNITWRNFTDIKLTDLDRQPLRLGEKIARLSKLSDGHYTSFISQYDFLQRDYFKKALNWYESQEHADAKRIFVGGFYVDPLSAKAPSSARSILSCSTPNTTYSWNQQSLYEHQLAAIIFNKEGISLLEESRISALDAVLASSILIDAVSQGFNLYRSPYLLLRVAKSHFKAHYDAYAAACKVGFWNSHYSLVSNYNHEMNVLYDIHFGSTYAAGVTRRIVGHENSSAVVDPAVLVVNNFINRIRPFYRKTKQIKSVVLMPLRWGAALRQHLRLMVQDVHEKK